MTEKARLNALYQYEILNTEAEEEFNDIAKLARQICDTPVVMINFIDKERVWSKSQVGIKFMECPRDEAFCAHTLNQDSHIIIEDLTKDNRFKDHFLVKEHAYTFYAGFPLKTADGFNIGTICILDKTKRELTTGQLLSLQALSKQVMNQLNYKKNLKDERSKSQDLLEKKQSYRLLVENMKAIVFKTDVNGNWTFLSPAWDEILGHKKEDCIGKLFLDYVHPDDREGNIKKFIPLVNKEKEHCRHQVRYMMKDGSYRWMEIFARAIHSPAGELTGTSGTITDIHDKRVFEDKFQEEKKTLDLITNNLGDVVWMTDPNKSRVVYVSPSYEKVWERSCEHVLQDSTDFVKAIHPDDKERIINAFSKQVKGTYNETYRIITPDGKIKWIEDRAYPIQDESKSVFRVVGIASDITQKMEVENELREQKEKFQTIVNNIPLFMTMYDENGIEWANSSFEKILGWSLEEVQKINVMEKFYPDPEYRQQVIDYMASPQSDSWKSFNTHIKNGKVIPTSWMNVKLSSGKCIGIGQDNTLQHQQEKLIREQQIKIVSAAKMSSLGEMAAGVAHEINNPLTIIMGKIEIMKNKIKNNNISHAETVEFCEKIDLTVRRIAKIISGLKTFARDGSQDNFDKVSVSAIIQDTLSFCEAKFRNNNVKLIVEILQEDIHIECRSVQISQVLLNLLNNAYDAVVNNQNSWVRLKVEISEENFIKISVEDSGKGIPEDIRDKIMQPFFTTKEVGKGTGLGLSLSRGLIESHNGELKLDAEAIHTKFVITLPLRHTKVT